MKKKIFFYFLLIFALIFVGTLFFKGKSKSVQAQMSRIGSTQIDAHEICRNVVNSGSRELMVPYKTKGEWCSFLGASLRDVSKTYCVTCYWKYCNCTNCGGVYVCENYNVGSCP
jgi:hypothetical protein